MIYRAAHDSRVACVVAQVGSMPDDWTQRYPAGLKRVYDGKSARARGDADPVPQGGGSPGVLQGTPYQERIAMFNPGIPPKPAVESGLPGASHQPLEQALLMGPDLVTGLSRESQKGFSDRVIGLQFGPINRIEIRIVSVRHHITPWLRLQDGQCARHREGSQDE